MEQKQTNKKGDRVVRSLYLLYLGYILGAVLLIVRIVQLQLTYQPDERITRSIWTAPSSNANTAT